MTPPSVTITLTRYREPDWLVNEALDSLAAQEGVIGEVIFLDQNWTDAFADSVAARSTEDLIFRPVQCAERCLSHARNEGLRLAAHDVVLFTEPDVIAHARWARLMADELVKGAAIAGSRILPKWRARPPLLARARTVRDQYSILDWGEQTIDAARVVGAGFGINKRHIKSGRSFDENFGRRNGTLLGGEESKFCRDVQADGGRIVYVGGAIILHQVLNERLRWGWIMRRLFYAGLSRRQQGGAPSPSRKPGLWDWLLLPLILPPYAAGYFAYRGK